MAATDVNNTLTYIKRFNVNDIIPFTEFIEECKKSKKTTVINTKEKVMYCIIISINDIDYFCSVFLIKHNDSFIIHFTNTNTCSENMPFNVFNFKTTNVFLTLECSQLYGGISSKLATRIEFEQQLHNKMKLTKLDSLIYIRCVFYRMIGVTMYSIVDSTYDFCKHDSNNNNYAFFISRLYETKTSINQNVPPMFKYKIKDLSIYYKYFNYKIYIERDSEKNKEFLQETKIDLSRNEDLQEYGLVDLINWYRALSYEYPDKTIKPYYKILGKGKSAYNNADCNDKARINWNLYEKIAYKMGLYYDITLTDERVPLRVLIIFRVNNKDCIYYPKDLPNVSVPSAATNAVVQPGGGRYTKKRRYRKKCRYHTRK